MAALLKGMQAGVAAVIASVVVDMAGDIFRQKRLLPTLIMAAAFLVTLFCDINVVWIILACAVIGIVAAFRQQAKGQKEGDK